VSQGSGAQHNATQIGGQGNSQYNANTQNFHYHNALRQQGE
jgi:hypothetical protein